MQPIHRENMQVSGTTRALGGFDAAPTAGKAARGERSFHAALTAESPAAPATTPKPATAPKPAAAVPATPTTDASSAAAKAALKVPKGERHEDVAGHTGYDEIVAGPRNGMFINTSGNAREGQAFTLVERGGFSYHVYGTGKDRQVFRVGRPEDDGSTPSPKAGTTTQTKPTPATGTTAAA